MTAKERALATDIYSRIVGNVDDFHEGRIDYETFSERQRGLWTTLDAAGPEVKRAVLADIRERLPSPASRLTPRPTPLLRAALAAAAEGRWSSLDKSVQQAIRRLAEDGWIDLDEHIPNEARGLGLTAAGRLLLASWRVAEGAEQGQPDRPPHLRAAELAALAWSTASGGLLRAVIREGAAGSIDLVVQRAPSPHAPACPSLVDHHLVWLVLDTTRPDDREVGERLVRALDKLGITATITALDATALAARRDRGDYDLVVAQVPMAATGASVAWAQAFAAGGDDWARAQLARGGLDPAAARAQFAKTWPVVPLYFRAVRVHHRTDVRGLTFDGSARLGLADAFLFGLPRRAP